MSKTIDYIGKIGPAFGGVILTLTQEGGRAACTTVAPVSTGVGTGYPDYRTALNRAIFYTDN